MPIETLDFKRQNRKAWDWEEYKQTLEYPECYSKELLDETKRQFDIITGYFKYGGTSIRQWSKKHKIERRRYHRLLRDFLLITSLEDLIRRLIRYNGKLGLELAKTEVRVFQLRYKRPPKTKDRTGGIRDAIVNGKWKEYGVSTWNHLLMEAIGEINHNRDIYTGVQGFERAKAELLTFYNKYQRIPKSDEKELMGIKKAVTRGEWADLGFHRWTDLQDKIFGKRPIRTDAKYYGKKGLNLAKQKLRELYEQNGKIPRTTDPRINTIYIYLRTGAWHQFGIYEWVDLCQQVVGK